MVSPRSISSMARLFAVNVDVGPLFPGHLSAPRGGAPVRMGSSAACLSVVRMIRLSLSPHNCSGCQRRVDYRWFAECTSL